VSQGSGGVVVREVRREDRAVWQVLWDGYNAFYGRHGDTALPGHVTEATWERFFDPAEPVHALVATLDGAIVGLTHHLYHRTTVDVADTCYLQDLFTDERARGRGVARALIAEVARRAKERGSSRVYWMTHETNATAMVLYDQVADRSGFLVYRLPL
jgi:GNAT superfamily N-acetyltransferase